MDIIIKFDPPNPTQVIFPQIFEDKKEVLYHLLLDAFFIIQKYKSSPIISGNVIDIKEGRTN